MAARSGENVKGARLEQSYIFITDSVYYVFTVALVGGCTSRMSPGGGHSGLAPRWASPGGGRSLLGRNTGEGWGPWSAGTTRCWCGACWPIHLCLQGEGGHVYIFIAPGSDGLL